MSFEIKIYSDEGKSYTFTDWEDTKLYHDFESIRGYTTGDVVWYDLTRTAGDDYELGGVE